MKRQGRRAVWWLGVLVMAAAVAAGAVLISRVSTAEWRQALAGGSAALVVLLLARVLVLRRRLAAERAAHRKERRTAAARAGEVTRLAAVRLPAITERVRAGRRLDGIPGPIAPEAETGEEFARALATVVAALGSDEAVRRERGLRDSLQAAFASVARTVHAMATAQQQVLDHVERTIDDPRLMAEVMKADHAAAQMTRKAQTLLVMCGIWPARRESRPVSLYDCVRGAQSRITEFGRVEVHGGQTLFVVPPAVEGLMHAIAELLENATVFSPSRTHVVVTVREMGGGAVVEIDDAGPGMPPDVLHHAMSQLRDGMDLTRLGAVPRLGLACVGRWSRELGFSVELTGASAYGGTRAVTFLPRRLLTKPLSHVPPERAREHERPVTAAERAVRAEAGPEALPRRRSRRRAPATALEQGRERGRERGEDQGRELDRTSSPAPQASQQHPPQHAQPAPDWTPEAARASITSVVTGSRRGRAAAVQDTEVPDQHDGGRQ